MTIVAKLKNNPKTEKMAENVELLIEKIKLDYVKGDLSESLEEKPWRKKMIDDFNESIDVLIGSRYLKIMTGSSVWGFIVLSETDKKFPYGDILKAASWKTPTRNFSRGTVFDEEYYARWVGS